MGPDSKIRIVIVEEHRLFREGIRRILNEENCLEIVGEAPDGLEAIDVIRDLRPDVVLLGITMPDLDGIKAIPIIKQKSSKTKVLLFTAFHDEAKILKFLQAGAKGYLSKNTSISDFIKAIKMVHKDELWIERELTESFFNTDILDVLDKEEQKKKVEELTPREKDVLRNLIKGSTNKEIANILLISEKTVKSHLSRIFKKLNVSTRLNAILYAIKSGRI